MLVAHPFDIALVARSRRRQLKLRQTELAKAAGVSREWIGHLERGKPGLELGRVLATLRTLNIEISLHFCGDPPPWSIPFTDAAIVRQRRLDNLRPRRQAGAERRGRKLPADWGKA